MTETTRLTDADRTLLAKTGELRDRLYFLASLTAPDRVRVHTGTQNIGVAYAIAFGMEARATLDDAAWLLGELAAIVTRLDGLAAAQVTEAGHG